MEQQNTTCQAKSTQQNQTCAQTMAGKQNQATEEKLLNNIYQNVKMGVDAINTLLPKVEDQAMRQDLTTQLLGYEEFSTQATKLLLEQGKTPKEISAFQKIPAEAGIHMNTLRDRSNSNIAEMMINGSIMGIIDTTRTLNQCRETCPKQLTQLAHDIIDFEDNNVTRMRAYL